MEIRQIQAFILLAQYENMSVVAHIMNTSQPQISRLISVLEMELGGELFDRVGRNVRINARGELFNKYAENALANIETGAQALRKLANLALGTITIGMFAFGQILNPCIIAYAKDNPQIDFVYSFGISNFPALINNIDILLTASRSEHYLAEDHFPISNKLFDEEYHVILAPTFREFPPEKTSLTPDEMREFPYIATKAMHPYRDDVSEVELVQSYIGTVPRVAFGVSDFLNKITLVSSGLGAAILPTSCLPLAKKMLPSLRIFSMENLSMHRSVFIARKKDPLMSKASMDFWKFSLEYYG